MGKLDPEPGQRSSGVRSDHIGWLWSLATLFLLTVNSVDCLNSFPGLEETLISPHVGGFGFIRLLKLCCTAAPVQWRWVTFSLWCLKHLKSWHLKKKNSSFYPVPVMSFSNVTLYCFEHHKVALTCILWCKTKVCLKIACLFPPDLLTGLEATFLYGTQYVVSSHVFVEEIGHQKKVSESEWVQYFNLRRARY